MKQLRFALIGCGRIAERHAEHIIKNGILIAVCDIIKSKASFLGEKYSATVYNNIDELLVNERIDVVSICTPNGLHAEHTIKSLQAGNHVLCEKPMAINIYDCGRMIQEAEKANKQLFIVKQNRFNPPVVEVKKIIDAGMLGKFYSVHRFS